MHEKILSFKVNSCLYNNSFELVRQLDPYVHIPSDPDNLVWLCLETVLSGHRLVQLFFLSNQLVYFHFSGGADQLPRIGKDIVLFCYYEQLPLLNLRSLKNFSSWQGTLTIHSYSCGTIMKPGHCRVSLDGR